MSNLVPAHYRSVSVTDLEAGGGVALNEASLRSFFVGREAYRRTAYIVVRQAGAGAVVAVTKASEQELFSPIVALELLAGPDDCALVDAPEADVGVPTQLAAAALALAPGIRCAVVTGRYRHISFILDPQPYRIRVVEVAPPLPAKLVDQARRLLDVAEELPPLDLRPEVFDLVALAAEVPSSRYLFPCRGSGVAPPGAEVAYLDQRPARQPWVLVGCARSRQFHRWFYGEPGPAEPGADPDPAEPGAGPHADPGAGMASVDMCPRRLAAVTGDGPTLTKCCLLEAGIERDGDCVVVPWGASLDEVREGLREVARIAERPGERQERAEHGWAPV